MKIKKGIFPEISVGMKVTRYRDATPEEWVHIGRIRYPKSEVCVVTKMAEYRPGKYMIQVQPGGDGWYPEKIFTPL